MLRLERAEEEEEDMVEKRALEREVERGEM
jgi:hypothetical protein